MVISNYGFLITMTSLLITLSPPCGDRHQREIISHNCNFRTWLLPSYVYVTSDASTVADSAAPLSATRYGNYCSIYLIKPPSDPDMHWRLWEFLRCENRFIFCNFLFSKSLRNNLFNFNPDDWVSFKEIPSSSPIIITTLCNSGVKAEEQSGSEASPYLSIPPRNVNITKQQPCVLGRLRPMSWGSNKGSSIHPLHRHCLPTTTQFHGIPLSFSDAALSPQQHPQYWLTMLLTIS